MSLNALAYWVAKFAGCSCLVCFLWAAVFHFRHPKDFLFRKTLISLSGLVATTVNLYFLLIRPVATTLASGVSIFLFLTALGIFVWSVKLTRKKLDFAFSISKPTEVIVEGPYRYLRHPFYTSYMICWFACFVFTMNWWVLLSAIWMFCLYYSAAKFEEKSLLEGPFGEKYSKYRQRKMFAALKKKSQPNHIERQS
jgi:protein-S-isoprenylcysteine O-methyltransferase Ste14